MAVLADRVALVTDASSGIGAGLAAMLAGEGRGWCSRPGAVSSSSRGSRYLPGGRVAVPVVTDLADNASLANLVARACADLGPVDALVNNTGFGL